MANQPLTLLHPAQFALSANTVTQQQQQHEQQHEQQQLDGGHVDESLSSADDHDIDCGPGNDLGFCAFSPYYPREAVEKTLERCSDSARAMYAEIPDDLASLADAHSVHNSSQVDSSSASWSWADYKKESACDSQLRYIEPQVARHRSGGWKVVVQSSVFVQRVAIDVCRHVNDVCKVFTDCGRRSRCVQRYSYHPLIVLDPRLIHNCPTMQVFRFPTSCVCHVEVNRPDDVLRSPTSV